MCKDKEEEMKNKDEAHRVLCPEMNIISVKYTGSTSNNKVYCRAELMLNGSAAE